MKPRTVTAALLGKEISFSTSRSGGPGGQHVNKVNSKVMLQFDIAGSAVLSEDEKELLTHKLRNRLSNEGILTVTAQESRSQIKNKETAVRKFDELIARAFEKKKKRKPTRPTKRAVQDRIKDKRTRSDKKKWRRKPGAGDGA